MADIVTIDAMPAAERSTQRQLRRLSRALSILFSAILVFVIANVVALIIVCSYFGDHVWVQPEGLDIVFGEHATIAHPGSVMFSAQPFVTKLAGAVNLVIATVPVAMIFVHLRGLFALYAAGRVFEPENARHLKRIGLWLIAFPFATFAANMLFQAAGGLDHAWFKMSLIHALVLGAIVFVIAQVMELGREIEEERDSFV